MFDWLKNRYKTIFPPYRDAFRDYPPHPVPRYGQGHPPHPGLYQIIDRERDTYRTLIGKCLEQKKVLHQLSMDKGRAGSWMPWLNNPFMPALDMISLYSLIGHFKPSRYIEIGCGISTRMAALAIRDLSPGTEIISVDPDPEKWISGFNLNPIAKKLEDAPEEILSLIRENDLLFLDGTHRLLPNSDVMVFFLEILPRLPGGVIVQIHDVYLPYDYPPFMCDRLYSEQYVLATMLLSAQGKFQLLLPNYFISQDPALSEMLSPLWHHPGLATAEHHGGSFWFQTR